VHTVYREFDRVDVLVNNAGIGSFGPFAEMDQALGDRIVAVNLLAAIRLTRAVLPEMIERDRGRIVNVSSVAGHVGVPGEAVYAATKAALIIFSDSLRYELAGSGVGVTVISPGTVDTAFFERRGHPYERGFPKQIPAERVAAAVVRAVREDRDDLFVPAWGTLPSRLRGAFPGLYRFLAVRLDKPRY
jgi:short-subunit dehydrogenase